MSNQFMNEIDEWMKLTNEWMNEWNWQMTNQLMNEIDKWMNEWNLQISK